MRSTLPFLALLLVFFGIGTVWFLPALRNLMIEQKKNETRDLVRTVWSIAESLESQVRIGELSEADAREIFLTRVRSLRFGDEMKDYYWVHDLEGTVVAHPYHDTIDLSNYRDSNGLLVVPAMNEVVRVEGEGFLEYLWQYNDETGREGRKISYLKLYEPWGWVIGSGFYAEAVKGEIDAILNPFLRIVGFVAGGILILIVLSIRRDVRATRTLEAKKEEARTSEHYLRHMAHNVDQGIAIFEGEQCRFSNARIHEILGLSSIPETSSSELGRKLGSLFEGATNNLVERWYHTPAGERRFLFLRRSCDVQRKTCFVIGVDRTARKLREEEIERLSRIIQESPISVMVTDPAGIIEYANPHVARVTGFSVDELLGKKPNVLKSNQVPQSVFEQLWATISQGRTWRGEILNKRKDGSLFWEDTVIKPLFDENEFITNFVALKTDITNRKRLEMELLEAKEKAEESDRLKSAFLANISHEIRTPLNAIAGFAEVLDTSFGSDREQFDRLVATITENVESLTALVDDVLEFSKLEAGHGVITRVDCNLENIVRELGAKGVCDPAPAPGVDLHLSPDPVFSHRLFRTDPRKLERILRELLSNAAKFTETGSIEIGYRNENELPVFYVRDTGVGISEKDKPHVFALFEHGEDHYVPLHRGTGLGLNIARRLVEMMGGEIWFESRVGEGTCFYVSGVCEQIDDSPTASAPLASAVRN